MSVKVYGKEVELSLTEQDVFVNITIEEDEVSLEASLSKADMVGLYDIPKQQMIEFLEKSLDLLKGQ